MKKISLLFMILFLHLPLASAYELNGTMVSNGSQDTYVVELENDDGHSYDGLAVDMGNGVLKVNVTDGQGEHFKGIAQYDDDGDYHLSLTNVESGDTATGELTQE